MFSNLLDFISDVFDFIYDTIMSTESSFPAQFGVSLFVCCSFLGILAVKRSINH